jgi:hypothetical protein
MAMSNLLVMVYLGLALLAAGVVMVVLSFPSESPRTRIAREAREAEQRVTDINRQAQAAILNEALRQAQARPTATRLDRVHPSKVIDNLDGQFGPWND